MFGVSTKILFCSAYTVSFVLEKTEHEMLSRWIHFS